MLGLDLGQARIGVAISDPARLLAVPMGTVRTGAPGDVQAIAALVRDHAVTLVVVGLPLRLSGERGPEAAHAERFAAKHGVEIAAAAAVKHATEEAVAAFLGTTEAAP